MHSHGSKFKTHQRGIRVKLPSVPRPQAPVLYSRDPTQSLAPHPALSLKQPEDTSECPSQVLPHLCPQPSRAPISSLRRKAQTLPEALYNLPHPLLAPPCSLHSSHTGFYTGCSLCLECPSTRNPHSSLQIFARMSPSQWEASLSTPFKVHLQSHPPDPPESAL